MNAPADNDIARIVVGVDGSEQSKLALRWATRLAALTDTDIDAVMVWNYPVSFGWSAGWAYTSPGWNPEADVQKGLTETIDEVYGPTVPLDCA